MNLYYIEQVAFPDNTVHTKLGFKRQEDAECSVSIETWGFAMGCVPVESAMALLSDTSATVSAIQPQRSR